MLECVVDSREQSLWEDLRDLPIPTRTAMLPLGDVLIQREEEVLLLLERKTVRDLIQSLKDGRYHDQRRRWLEFRDQSPQSSIAVWIEGDLLATEMDPALKSALVNSLFRLQSKHHILVHQTRTREAFVKSLYMVVEKLSKDPYHLVPDGTTTITTTPTMNQYKKSAHSLEQYWQDCLTLVPGVSPAIAQTIQTIYPTLVSIVEALRQDPQQTLGQIAQLRTNGSKRRLGEKLAYKIVQHLDPSFG